MKTLTIAALSSVAILMGASAGFAATGTPGPVQVAPAQHMIVSEAATTSGLIEVASNGNSQLFRCADGQRDGVSTNPNLNFCAPGA